MLTWFSAWKLRRRRELFHFWDGSTHRAIDPLVAFRAIHTDKDFRADVHPALADEGDEEALTILLGMVQRVFGVSQYTERSAGLTQAQQIVLYLSFCTYLETIKKNISVSPILQRSTEPTCTDSKAPITNGSSESTSPCQESNSAEPTLSDSA